MHLFINAVSQKGKLILFNDERKIMSEQDISLLLHESSKLISTVDTFLRSSNVTYGDLENIVVVHGPGSFTGIRTIVLYVNTLAFVHPNIQLTPISFFELYNRYPIVKKSSKRDLFVKKRESGIIEVVQNQEFTDTYGKEAVCGDAIDIGIVCHDEIQYSQIIGSVKFTEKKQIEPLYIKKPNIT